MKELQVPRAAVARRADDASDDGNDEPPPLELELKRGNGGEHVDNQTEDPHQEDTSVMDEMVVAAQRAKEETRRRQEMERNSRTFGHGLKKGFFNAKPRGSRATAAAAGGVKTAARKLANDQEKKMPTREDLLIVKQKSKEEGEAKASSDSRFVFPEVQSALRSMNQLDPKSWMDAKFFEKLARNPRLALALQNSRFTQAIDEMQRDPEAAIRKYQNDAAVSTMLQDFLGFLGSHFEEIVDLDEARRGAIANMERSPEEDAQVQKILQSPELLQALSDADLMARLQRCRASPQELRRLQSDPVLARKLRLLADAGLVRFE